MSADLRVVEFPSRCGDVIAMLRGLADDIEAGKLEPQRVIAVIDDPSGLVVRGFGDSDIFVSIALLQCGSAKLASMVNSGEAR